MNFDADNFYTALSHPMRLRALMLIKAYDELCVCELVSALNLAQPVMSRHLAQLKEAGLLTSRRQGVWIYYRVNPHLPDWMKQVIKITNDSVSECSPYKTDRLAIAGMQNRPNQTCH